MSKITDKIIRQRLNDIKLTNPASGSKSGIVDAHIVTSISLKENANNNDVSLVLDIGDQEKSIGESLAQKCIEELQTLDGVGQVQYVITSSTASSPAARKPAPTPKKLQGVKHVICVAAGKGGVGKSTVAVNLAITLAKQGYSTGLVDTDIYGPSVGRMMNLKEKPVVVDDKMVPPVSYGVKCMSMSLLINETEATVWRGSMAVKALYQLMGMTHWQGEDKDELDFLIVDLPPGTGDIHLSIAQNFNVDGTLLVSTPQDVALLDVQKAHSMLQKINAPIIGLVENMAYFVDAADNKNYIFGQGNVENFCAKNKVDFLGQIPINPDISAAGDGGEPMAVGENATAEIFATIAKKVSDFVDE